MDTHNYDYKPKVYYIFAVEVGLSFRRTAKVRQFMEGAVTYPRRTKSYIMLGRNYTWKVIVDLREREPFSLNINPQASLDDATAPWIRELEATREIVTARLATTIPALRSDRYRRATGWQCIAIRPSILILIRRSIKE